MRVGSLRQDVFLLAHDDDGRLIGPEPSISAGLAGATLIDLLLGARVAVVSGRLAVIDSAITGDPEADSTLEAIAGNTAPTGPRAWVSWISDGAYERTATSLEAAGVIRRNTVRRLGLNVFGDNHAATALYSGLGYQVTTQQMAKRLS